MSAMSNIPNFAGDALNAVRTMSNELVRYVVAIGSIIILFFLTKNIVHFFDIGIEIYGIYLMIAIVTLIFYAVLSPDINVFENKS